MFGFVSLFCDHLLKMYWFYVKADPVSVPLSCYCLCSAASTNKQTVEKSFTAHHKELAAIFSNHFELLVVMQPSYGRLHSPQIKSVQAGMTESRPSEARGWIICNRAETWRFFRKRTDMSGDKF